MPRTTNHRFWFLVVVLLVSATTELALEHRPSVLRPDLRLCAYVASADGNVTVIDLPRLAAVATIPVGPAPSGMREHPTRKEIWGVSTAGNYVWVIDAPSDKVAVRIPVGAAPFAVDFSPDGLRAYVASSGSGMLPQIGAMAANRSGYSIARTHVPRPPMLSPVA